RGDARNIVLIIFRLEGGTRRTGARAGGIVVEINRVLDLRVGLNRLARRAGTMGLKQECSRKRPISWVGQLIGVASGIRQIARQDGAKRNVGGYVGLQTVGNERVIQKLRTGKQLIDRPDRADVVLIILGAARSCRPQPDALL